MTSLAGLDEPVRRYLEHALRAVSLPRWGNVGREGYGYIPFGGHTEEELRFGDLVLPSCVVVGWWFDTPRYRPFFDARILRAAAPG